MQPKGSKFLKAAGAVSMLIGFIVVFIGFYIMSNGMLVNDITPEMRDEQLRTMQYLSAGGMYVMVMGGFQLFAGFVGFMNAANIEYAFRCIIYGAIIAAFGVGNFIILAIFSGKMSAMNAVIIAVPIILGAMYALGAYLNLREQ